MGWSITPDLPKFRHRVSHYQAEVTIAGEWIEYFSPKFNRVFFVILVFFKILKFSL